MIATERLNYKRLVRIADLVLSYKGQLPAFAEQWIDNLIASVSQLAALVGVQGSLDTRVYELDQARQEARVALRAELTAISLAAIGVAVDVPGFEAKFHPPMPGDAKLLAAARTFAGNAEPVAEQLRKFALPANFIADLKNRTEVFDKAAKDCAVALREAKLGRAAIDKLMDQANDATVRLDVLVRNTFRNDPTELSQWDVATKFGWSRSKTDDEQEQSSDEAASPPPAAATPAA